MKPYDPSLKASIAKPSDYEKIVHLCKRSVGPRDYALRILHDVINDRDLFLAWQGRELISMTNFDKSIDGSGWLSIARTDPAWRGRGVAIFLQQEIARHARRQGIRTLRLWVSSGNKSSTRACLKGGFRPVCEAVHLSHNLSRIREHKRPHPLKSIPEDTLKALVKSPYLTRMGGYMAYKWQFIRPNRDVLLQLLHQGELFSTQGSIFILTKPEKERRAIGSAFTLLHGRVSNAFRGVLQSAEKLHVNHIGGYLPHNRYLLSVGKRFGFSVDSWSRLCIVYEKMLP